MTSQKGSAIVIVMMMMTILALAGAGLLIQSRRDTILTRSRVGYDRTLNLADGASRIGMFSVQLQNIDKVKYTGQIVRNLVGESTAATRGYWDAFVVFAGFTDEAGSGYEAGQYWQQFWIAEGTGSRAVAWVSGYSYKKDDLVSHNGTTYKALMDGAGGDPGSGGSSWEVVAPNQSVVQQPATKKARLW